MKKMMKEILVDALRIVGGIAVVAAILLTLFWMSKGIGWFANWYQQATIKLWETICQNPARVPGIVGLIYLGAILSRIGDKLLAFRKKRKKVTNND